MAEISFSVPAEMADLLSERIVSAGHCNLDDYLCALIRSDIENAAKFALLREEIAKGKASGIIDRDPIELIEDIIANRRARHDR